jgi:hypothetical protein
LKKELNLVEGVPPKGFKADFESFLFNDERYRLLQSPSGWRSFCLLREDKKKLLAWIHFHVENQIARSPFKAPFGSVEYSKSLSPKDLYEFLRNVESRLRAQGVRRIAIKNALKAYHPVSSSLLEVLLLNLGYHISQAEIGAAIAVGEMKYDQIIEGWELRKLKQGKKAKLVFHEIPLTRIEEVYDFILSCRKERQQSLSMTLPELMRTVNSIPKNFILFGVDHQKKLAAASISVRVSKKIVYNFYSAHPRKMDFISPVVSLMQGIYRWAQRHHVEWIDLGTSAVDGQPNFGLLDFKIRLSGVLSGKFSFEKDLI